MTNRFCDALSGFSGCEILYASTVRSTVAVEDSFELIREGENKSSEVAKDLSGIDICVLEIELDPCYDV